VASFHEDQPPPCGTYAQFVESDDQEHDIVALTVTHTVDAVVAETRFRAAPRGEFYFEVHVRTHRKGYLLSVTKTRKYGLSADLTYEPSPPRELGPCGSYSYALTVLPCDGLALDRVDSSFRVTIPRTCLGTPEWVKVGVRLQSIDQPFTSDWWGRNSQAPNRFVGPLGPRVRADAG
jgi:hypothetical protein